MNSKRRLGDYSLTETDVFGVFKFEFKGFSRVAHIDELYLTLANLNTDVAELAFPKPVKFKSDDQVSKEKAAKRAENIANGLLKKENAQKEKK